MVDWLIGETHVWWINHHDQDFYSSINLEEVKPFCLGRCQEHYFKKKPSVYQLLRLQYNRYVIL